MIHFSTMGGWLKNREQTSMRMADFITVLWLAEKKAGRLLQPAGPGILGLRGLNDALESDNRFNDIPIELA